MKKLFKNRHCLDDAGAELKVLIGSDNVNSNFLGNINEGEIINARKEKLHPDYNTATDAYDMGLIFLDTPTTYDIPYPQLNKNNSYPEAGVTSYTMGWGATSFGGDGISAELLIVDLPVLSNDECEDIEVGGNSYEGLITNSMLCTFNQGKDACQGDSGESDNMALIVCFYMKNCGQLANYWYDVTYHIKNRRSPHNTE